VVVSNSSTAAMSMLSFPPLCLDVDCAGLVDAQHHESEFTQFRGYKPRAAWFSVNSS